MFPHHLNNYNFLLTMVFKVVNKFFMCGEKPNLFGIHFQVKILTES